MVFSSLLRHGVNYQQAITFSAFPASLAAVVEMVANNQLAKKGFIKQEEIDLNTFLATQNGSLFNTP